MDGDGGRLGGDGEQRRGAGGGSQKIFGETSGGETGLSSILPHQRIRTYKKMDLFVRRAVYSACISTLAGKRIRCQSQVCSLSFWS